MVKTKYKSLRGIRVSNGDRQCDVAEYIGISCNAYRLKEIGQTDFTVDEAKKIAKKYGKSLDEIFN